MKTATEHLYVAKTPNVCGGEPTIKGTRIPVRVIVDYWRAGVSPEEIRKGFPHLTLAQIFDALSYAEDHAGEIDRCIREDRVAYEKGLAQQPKRGRAGGA